MATGFLEAFCCAVKWAELPMESAKMLVKTHLKNRMRTDLSDETGAPGIVRGNDKLTRARLQALLPRKPVVGTEHRG